MAQVSIDVWRSLSQGEWDAVEAEALSLPLPGLNGPITAKASRVDFRPARRGLVE